MQSAFALENEQNVMAMELSEILGNEVQAKEILQHLESYVPKPVERAEKDYRTLSTELVIITNNVLLSQFQLFAKLKNEEGIATEVYSTSVIGSTKEQIRNWLQVLKMTNPDLKYVLLGGDKSIVPTQDLPWIKNGEPRIATTDFYYSNVLSAWPVDNDIMNVNMTKDLFVGRVPVNNPTDAARFRIKYLNYRRNKTEYANKMAFIATNVQKYPNINTDNIVVQDIMSRVPDSITKDFIGSDDLIDHVNGAARGVLDKLTARDYSFLYGMWHGGDEYRIIDYSYDYREPWNIRNFEKSLQSITINEHRPVEGGGWYSPQYVDSVLVGYDYYYVSPEYNHYRLQDELPQTIGNTYFAWLGSCFTTDMNFVSKQIPVLRDSLNEIVVTDTIPVFVETMPEPLYQADNVISQVYFNHLGGPVGVVASSTDDYPYFTSHNTKLFFDFLFLEDMHEVGELLHHCFDNYTPFLENHFFRLMIISYTLFGDPSMQIWSGKSDNLVLTADNSGANTIIKAMDSSGNAIDALICILDANSNLLAYGASPYTHNETISDNWLITANAPNFIQAKKTYSQIKSYSVLPYVMNFDNGVDKNWEAFTSNDAGRVLVTSEFSPYLGAKHLIMDSTTPGTSSINEARLHLNLENTDRVVCEFFWKLFPNETISQSEGVYISDDNGASFTKVFSFPLIHDTWTKAKLNIDSLMTYHNLNKSDNVILKFQQIGNDTAPSKGIAIDEVFVYNNYARLPFADGFEEGKLSYWEYRSSTSQGRIHITTQYEPYDGEKHLTMDTEYLVIDNVNEALLYINLEKERNIVLRFYWKSYSEMNYRENGVFFSDDGGDNFSLAYYLENREYDTWSHVEIDVSQKIIDLGLSQSKFFVIKFQQRGNNAIHRDGFAFDTIRIISDIPRNEVEQDVSLILETSNFPNPFNPTTTISFSISSEANVNLSIYNVKGQKVTTLVDEFKSAGYHTVQWNGKDNTGRDVASGIYFSKMRSGKHAVTKKMILLK
jgi:hypothetical protein